MKSLAVAVAASFLLVPAGAASAAKPHSNPWSEYVPAKGVACTSTVVHADGTSESETTKVLAKSAKKIVTYTSGEGRTTSLLLPGGKLRATAAMSGRESGMRMRVSLVENLPAPARLARHGSGSGSMTMTMTMPKRMAKVLLKHGRTLTIKARFRLVGAGTTTVTLADPAATQVEAFGIQTTLRSVTYANAKPAFVRAVKKEMATELGSLAGTQWIAAGRGTVRTESTDEDGAALTTTQVGCR